MPERYAEMFLLRMFSSRDGLDKVHGTHFTAREIGLDERKLPDVISVLARQGYIEVFNSRGIAIAPGVMFTKAGIEYAQELRRRSSSRVERETYLHNVLVRWAHRNAPPRGAASLHLFAADESWWFAGTEVTWDEVFAAVDYLEDENLLRVERTPGYTGIRPTSWGTNFAHSSMTLRTFMATQQPPSGGTRNYHGGVFVQGNVSNSNVAGGGNNSQAINQGVDADALVSLVSQLRQIAPALDLSEGDAEDLADEIDALEREGVDLGRGRRIWRSIKRILTPAVSSAIAAGSEQAVQAALTAGSDLFN